MPWITELGLSARILEGCASEPKKFKIQTMLSMIRTLESSSAYFFSIFYYTILYNTTVLWINDKKGRVFYLD